MLDDAHGFGVLGEKGRGTADHFKLTEEVDIIMSTFSKSMASLGGFIAGTSELIDYIQHHARSLIFSASMTPAAAATVLAALNIMEREPDRLERLWDNTRYAMKLLKETGLEVAEAESPIIPIYIRDNTKTFLITKELQEQDVFVNPVVSPAVASEDTLIRFSLMATHTFSQIEEAVHKLNIIYNRISLLEKK